MKFIFLSLFVASSLPFGAAAQVDSAAKLSTSADSDFWANHWSKIGLSYFNFASTPMEYANKQDGRLESYNYVGVEYKFNRDRKVAIRPAFLANLNGTAANGDYQDYEFKWSDLIINYQEDELIPLPGRNKVVSNFSVYLPTSKDTQDRDTIARLRWWLRVQMDLHKHFELTFHTKPSYFIQSRTGYLTNDNQVRGNKDWGHETSIEGVVKYDRTWAITQAIGFEQNYTHAVKVENVAYRGTDSMRVETGLSFMYKGIWLVGGASQSRDIRAPRNDYALFRPEESTYFLRSSIRIR